MLGTQWTGRKSTAERTAQQAWEYLSAAVTAAGDNASWARRRGAVVADRAGDKVGSAADVAWQRANAAVDALAGRRPATPWAWIAAAALAGVAVGVVAATAGRTAASRVSARSGYAGSDELTSADQALSAADAELPVTGPPAIEIVDVDTPTTAPARREP